MKYTIIATMNSGRKYTSMPTELDTNSSEEIHDSLRSKKGTIAFTLEDEKTAVILTSENIESLCFVKV